MLYFAMTLSTNQLPGNRFANAALAVCFEFAGNTLSWVIAEYLDRRKIFMLFSTITGVSLAIVPYLAEGMFCSIPQKEGLKFSLEYAPTALLIVTHWETVRPPAWLGFKHRRV